MRKILFLVVIISLICLSSMKINPQRKELSNTISAVGGLFEQHMFSLDSFFKEYPKFFYDSSFAVRQRKYQEISYFFKRAAGLMIYFEPDLYYSRLVSPFQFEKQERKGFFSFLPDNWLFTGPVGNEHDTVLIKSYKKEDSLAQSEFIRDATAKFREVFREVMNRKHFSSLDAPHLFEALRMELFRISSLDVANSDFIIEEAGLPSLRGSVHSWLLYANEFIKELPESNNQLRKHWSELSRATKSAVDGATLYNEFDRMAFIRDQLLPLGKLLNELQSALKVPVVKKWSAIRPGKAHIYDSEVFNADYFAPSTEAYYTADKAKLGELLFFDPILSDNNERACASCHKPSMAFTDGLVKATAFERVSQLARNSPTVINAGFQKKNFWDLRASSLEAQLDSVVNNPDELHSSFDRVIGKINSSPEYLQLFYKAFPETQKSGVTRNDVKNAIGVYERTITGLNSRFDQYMRGDATKLTKEEIRGFNVYMGKARCGTCHFAPLFNGAFPPFFDITDHHSIGVPLKDTMESYRIDPDAGLFKLSASSFTKFSFKTPTIRNAALTAPYMHNGVFKTLEQVIEFYDHAGGNKFQKEFKPDMTGLPFLTLIPLQLKLTTQEKKDLISFIHALNDTSAARSPQRLPELKGKYAGLNKRVIGGEY